MSIISVVEDGIKIAKNVLDFVTDNQSSSQESNDEYRRQMSLLSNQIKQSTDKLERIIKDSTQQILDKIETDNLEKLTASAQSLQLALDLDDEVLSTNITSKLFEYVGYSSKRIDEGKKHWFGPWLIGKSLILLALQNKHSSLGANRIIENEILKFRLEILNRVKYILVEEDVTPWILISEFVSGSNQELLTSINFDKFMTPEPIIEEPSNVRQSMFFSHLKFD
ncbi:MAG: hypothetical protein ACI88H_000664 [Cocleimonas sp.]|jgi:hypothetical protein